MDLRELVIREIEATIEVAATYLRGEIPLEQVNERIPESERYPSLDAVAVPIVVTAHHYIDFAIRSGLLDRKADADLLRSLDDRLRRLSALAGEHDQHPQTRARRRLDIAIAAANSGEPLPPEVLDVNPQALTSDAERQMLILCAVGEISMAHHLGLLTDAERDEYLRRLPPLPQGSMR